MALPTIQQVVDAYRETQSTLKVAERFGCSVKAVRNRLAAAGEPVGPPGLTRHRERDGGLNGDRVVVAYRYHRNINKAAAVVGVNPSTARTWLKLRGIETGRRPSRQQIREARRRYLSGETSREIAAAIGFDAKTVIRALRNEGIPIRPAARRPKRTSSKPVNPTPRSATR